MGCALSKLFGGGNNHEHLSEGDTEEAPKQYSWEKKDKIDVKNFMIDGAKDEVIGRMPGSIKGQQFIIQNCQNCDIYVFDHCATVTVDDCINCRIYIAAIKTSIFIRDSTDCAIATCCQQFRTRDCKKLECFLSCVTQPIIEATTGIKFGCLQIHYPQLRQQIKDAGISVFNNNWNSIHDFTQVPGENNYGILPQTANMTDFIPFPTKEPYNGIELTIDQLRSEIPYTLGIKQRPSGHKCLVAIFPCNHQRELADHVSSSLLRLSLVQTAEVKLSSEQAKNIFSAGTDLTKVKLRGTYCILYITGLSCLCMMYMERGVDISDTAPIQNLNENDHFCLTFSQHTKITVAHHALALIYTIITLLISIELMLNG